MTKQIDIAALTDEQIELKLEWANARNGNGRYDDLILRLEAEQVGRETEEEEEEARPASVVREGYKAAYRAKGKTKAEKRGCGDWLHGVLIVHTLDGAAKPVPGAFEAVLAANGVDAERWARLNPGQRRMCGGLALRKVAAANEALVLPNGETLTPPAAFVARYA